MPLDIALGRLLVEARSGDGLDDAVDLVAALSVAGGLGLATATGVGGTWWRRGCKGFALAQIALLILLPFFGWPLPMGDEYERQTGSSG